MTRMRLGLVVVAMLVGRGARADLAAGRDKLTAGPWRRLAWQRSRRLELP